MNHRSCALFIMLIVGTGVWSQASAQDAPMFRGNLQHTGVYNAPGVAQFKQIKWKFHTSGRVISSPAVVGGVAYFGSTDGNLYAVNIASGKLTWKFATGSWVVSSPAVASGIVYFGSYDSNFYAVDATTGQLKWKFQTGGERRYAGKHLHHLEPAAERMPDPWDFFLSSPSVWNGVVYFGSGDGNVYALDANSGALKWKFQTGDVVHSSPAIADGTLYIGSWDTYLYALDAGNGKEKWRFKTGDDPEFQPCRDTGVACSGGRRGVFRVPRCECVCGGRHDRQAEMEFLRRRIVGEQLGCSARRQSVRCHLDPGKFGCA